MNPYEKPVHTNFVNYMLIFFMMWGFTLTLVLDIEWYPIYAVVYLCYAVLQGALQNVLVALLTRKFTTTEDGSLMGFWAASSHIGNIVSLLTFTVMIFYLKINWKWCLILAPTLSFIGAGLVKIF